MTRYAASLLRTGLSAICGPAVSEPLITCARNASIIAGLLVINHCATSKRAVTSTMSWSISARAFSKLSSLFRQLRLNDFSVASEQSDKKCKGISSGVGTVTPQDWRTAVRFTTAKVSCQEDKSSRW